MCVWPPLCTHLFAKKKKIKTKFCSVTQKKYTQLCLFIQSLDQINLLPGKGKSINFVSMKNSSKEFYLIHYGNFSDPFLYCVKSSIMHQLSSIPRSVPISELIIQLTSLSFF